MRGAQKPWLPRGVQKHVKSAAVRVDFAVPSAQSLDLFEVLTDEVGAEKWVRFRFLAPDIGRAAGQKTFADVEADFEPLCRDVVLPYLAEYQLEADVAVVTFLDREVPFGATDADATQYIEVFRVSSGQCAWEGL